MSDNIDNMNEEQPKIYFTTQSENGDYNIEVGIVSIDTVTNTVILKPQKDENERPNRIQIFSGQIGIWKSPSPLSPQEWNDICKMVFPKLYKKFEDKLS